MDDAALRQSILKTLAAVEPPALFATELRARLGPDDGQESGMDRAVEVLAEGGSVLLTTPSIPDPHLAAFDLRIVALIPPDLPPADASPAAMASTDVVWGRWLREFQASHRCQ